MAGIETGPQCEDCGEDTGNRPLHVHHRAYIAGREPWQYRDDDLRLLCDECHDRLHFLECRVRAFILAMPAHLAYEFADFMDELEQSGSQKAALAHAKNAARNCP